MIGCIFCYFFETHQLWFYQVLLWSLTILTLSFLAGELLEQVSKAIYRFIGLQLSSNSFALMLSTMVILKGAMSIPSFLKRHKSRLFCLSICLNLFLFVQPDLNIDSLAKIFSTTDNISTISDYDDTIYLKWSLIILAIVAINLSMQTINLELNEFRVIVLILILGICTGIAYTIQVVIIKFLRYFH